MERNNLSYNWVKALILLFTGVLPLAAYSQLCDTLQVPTHTSQSISQEETSLTKADHRRLWAVKTNMLLWGVLAPNVEIEAPLGTSNSWSVEGELFFPWWTWDHNTYATQALNVGAEVRYRLATKKGTSFGENYRLIL